MILLLWEMAAWFAERRPKRDSIRQPTTSIPEQPPRPYYPEARPFLAEPFFDLVERRGYPRIVLFGLLVVFGLLLAIGAESSHEFWAAGSLARTVADFKIIVGYAPSDNLNYFPLSRDYTAISVSLGAALTVPLIFRNCTLMRSMVQNLVSWDAQSSDGPPAKRVRAEIEELNRSFERAGRSGSVICVALSVLSAVFLYLTFDRQGAFGALATLPSAADADWWASVREGHWIAAVSWLLVCSACCYIFIKNNVLGYCFLRFFWRIRNDAWFGVDPLNEDGYHGWRPLRRLLASVYVAILLSGLPAIVYGQSIGSSSVVYAAPILALLLASIPLLGVAPLVLLKVIGDRYRATQAADIRRAFEERTAQVARDSPRYWREVTEARTRVALVAEMRPRLFRPAVIVIVAALYVVPLVSFVTTYLK
ncbi:hypothetical protein [Microlunatus flavus]|uniref:Uncharacterized protein n=1 Tax=Microlunatus flavus TaxID=1036181 RepID=A0A1H9CTM7_9ACTN|nr:hypothetical protein [Microlunatus flavus]SEQ04509.1 hypothetical protein SAMN05421756_102323 [Microlunatus flavus]